jgi:hypothetical protein
VSSFNLRRNSIYHTAKPDHPKLQGNAFTMPLGHWENLALDFMGAEDWTNAAHAWRKCQAAATAPSKKARYAERAAQCQRRAKAA